MKLQALIRNKYASLTSKQKKQARIVGVLIALLLAYLLFRSFHALWFGNVKLPKPLLIRNSNGVIIPSGSPLRTQMHFQTVTSTTQPHAISFPGFIEADPTTVVNVLPPVTGRLMAIHVGLGDEVEVNQLLAEISSPDLAQADADKDKAKSAVTLSEEILPRAKEVYRIGGNSVQEIQQAENDYIQAKSEASRAEARLRILGKNNANILAIRSPLKGRITAIYYGVGSYINDLTAVFMTINNTEQVWVTAYIPEHLSGVVAAKQLVNITFPAYPNLVFHGKVSFVNSFLEADSRTNKTRIKLANPRGKFQPNMFANVQVQITQPSQIMIPLSSILMNNDKTTVYVESKPWTCERREVELGEEDGDSIRVLSGLKEGERVVVGGGVLIND